MAKIKPPLGSVKTWERLEELQKTPGAVFHVVSFFGNSMLISKRFRAWDFLYDGVTLACKRQRYWPEGYARIDAHMFPRKGDLCEMYTKPDKTTATQFVIFSSKSAADAFCRTLKVPEGKPSLDQEFEPPERGESPLPQGVRNATMTSVRPEGNPMKSRILTPEIQFLEPPPYKPFLRKIEKKILNLDFEATSSTYFKFK